MDRTDSLNRFRAERRFHPPLGRAPLSEAKPDISNGFTAEALFQLAQNFGPGDSLQLVVQRWLEDADVEDAVTERNRCGMGGDEFSDDRGPGVDDLAFAQSLFQAELLH